MQHKLLLIKYKTKKDDKYSSDNANLIT